MGFAGECTRVYTRRGHSAHLLAPEGTMRSGVLCEAGKRVTEWLGTGSDAERERAARLMTCERCAYEAWTEDEYRSEGPQDRPQPPLTGLAAECTRLYARTGTIAHLARPWLPLDAGVFCNVAPFGAWLGTGSQAEYDKAALLPLCGRCLHAAQRSAKFKAPAPATPLAGAGLDGCEVPPCLAPAPGESSRSASRGGLPGSPDPGSAARPVPVSTPVPGAGRAPSSPVPPMAGGTGAGEQVAKPPSRTAPEAAPTATGATAGVPSRGVSGTPAPEAPLPSQAPATQGGRDGEGQYPASGNAGPLAGHAPAGGDADDCAVPPAGGQAPAGGGDVAASPPLAGQGFRDAWKRANSELAKTRRNQRGHRPVKVPGRKPGMVRRMPEGPGDAA